MNEYSKSLKIFSTIVVIWSSFNYMLAGSSFRSTLIDFKEITNTTMEKMSFSLMFRFLGCCVGAALRAFSIIIGQLTQLWSVFFVQFLIGVSSGAIDVTSASQIFQLWKDEGGPYMQALSLAYNVAGICSPLMFEPFLSPTKEYVNLIHTKNDSLTLLGETFNTTFDIRESFVESNTNESRIWIPLSIIGLMLITSGLLVLSIPIYVFLKTSKMNNTKSEINSEITSTNNSKSQTKTGEMKNDVQVKDSHWKRFKFYILTLCSIVFCIYYAIHDTIMQFWFTFAVNCDLKLTKSQTAFMLSGMTTSYSVSGLIGIYVTTKVKPFKMLVSLVIMIAMGNIIHIFFANTSLSMLWFGALIEYAGFGCFYATVFNYMQSKVGLTTKMCSILVVWSYLASGIGYTSLIGYYVEARPMILIYNNIGCSAIVALLMFAIYKLDAINKRKNEEYEIELSLKNTAMNSKKSMSD
ncbi:sodium-dependent glucose transporter 1-like protein [Leptotrombidium deliense]|uniref:Sodium-dependent glucose transporter 1-like protein n=1 Tax=Leptotrombidium deliense TaxID=299467 RepID=A0A443S4M3_9ACAR|nr:sodium-dependent glucose transporter 1-like protein [Leptotrombidium deliense]